ncbi:MAG: hypothetical protein ACNA8W_02425 [Bradymonadaceae bacterium]
MTSPRDLRAHHRGAASWAILAFLGIVMGAFGATSCVNDEQVFVQGRLQNPCNTSIPICRVRGSCVLRGDEYVRGTFPGGFRAIVHNNDVKDARLVVRFLLTEMIAPGTELHVQLHTPDCGGLDEAHPRDIDLFEYAGRDRIIEFHLDIEGRGDHLLEIFSDMSADYLLTVTIEDK